MSGIAQGYKKGVNFDGCAHSDHPSCATQLTSQYWYFFVYVMQLV